MTDAMMVDRCNKTAKGVLPAHSDNCDLTIVERHHNFLPDGHIRGSVHTHKHTHTHRTLCLHVSLAMNEWKLLNSILLNIDSGKKNKKNNE